MIAKISLGLQKFRNHSENFAILAKLRIFARLEKFSLASEIYCAQRKFAISLSHNNFARLAKFR